MESQLVRRLTYIIGCLKNLWKTVVYLANQISVNDRMCPSKILNLLSNWLSSPIDKPTMKIILNAMHWLCTAMNDYSFEDSLFTKHSIYLKENKDNEEKSLELSKTMIVMSNMIEIFKLQSEENLNYWKVLHLFIEIMLEKYFYHVDDSDAKIRVISGSLWILSKVWIRCPTILKENTVLLNFFWHFTSQKWFESQDKVAILDIYRKSLCRNPPKWQKNSIIFRGGYDKGYKIFMSDEILFVCILIYLYIS